MTIERGEFEARVLAFEQAWRCESPPQIGDHVATQLAAADRGALLAELICIDLEYRWRRAAQDPRSVPWRLDDYAARFLELGSLVELPDELIHEEYRVRHRWGDRPNHAEFLGRFPGRWDVLLPALCAIDRELRREEQSEDRTNQQMDKAACERDAGNAALLSSGESRGASLSPVEVPSTFPARMRTPLNYGDYVLQEMIGAGRTGRVYRAWQKSLERTVAVKFLRKAFLAQRRDVERFLTEARVIAGLQHPGIVHVHGLGRTLRGGYFLVLEWIEQGDLMRQLAHGPVPIGSTVPWTLQAARTLQHVHDQGFIHCDLKPANVLLDRHDRVRITDFGLARSVTEAPHAWGAIEGTPACMAPEQVSPTWGLIDPRTDVYGLGAVLHMLLTGRPPVHGTSVEEILAEIAAPAAIPLNLESLRPIPPAIAAVCRRALAKSPADRFQSMLQFASTLAEACP